MAVPLSEQHPPEVSEQKLPWKSEDGPVIADLLNRQYSPDFQQEFDQLLENALFQTWISRGKDPLPFAETYFSASKVPLLHKRPASPSDAIVESLIGGVRSQTPKIRKRKDF